MGQHTIRRFLTSVLLLGACAVAGCAGEMEVESVDPSVESLLESAPGKDDAVDVGQRLLANLYPGVAQISDRGTIHVNQGVRYSDELHHDLPSAGVRISDGFMGQDPTLGIQAGGYTQIAVYILDKPAEQLGLLDVDTGRDRLAMQVFYKVAGERVRELPYLNGRPIDGGRIDRQVRYVILAAPGGLRGGEGSQDYSARIRIIDPR